MADKKEKTPKIENKINEKSKDKAKDKSHKDVKKEQKHIDLKKTHQHIEAKPFSIKTILLEPVTTEKIVRQIELENKIAFVVNRKATKKEIKEEIEATFSSKVDSVNTQIRNNKKIAFIKLKSDSPAIDIATKLGII